MNNAIHTWSTNDCVITIIAVYLDKWKNIWFAHVFMTNDLPIQMQTTQPAECF